MDVLRTNPECNSIGKFSGRLQLLAKAANNITGDVLSAWNPSISLTLQITRGFPRVELKPGQVYKNTIVYKFSTE